MLCKICWSREQSQRVPVPVPVRQAWIFYSGRFQMVAFSPQAKHDLHTDLQCVESLGDSCETPLLPLHTGVYVLGRAFLEIDLDMDLAFHVLGPARIPEYSTFERQRIGSFLKPV